MNKLLIPNTCQVPNVILDKVMPRIGNASLRVLLAITRFTYGFDDPSTRKISYTRLQKATALSRQAVANGINGLGNLITIKSGRKNERVENEYSLNLDIATGELVNELDPSTNLTSQRRVKRLVNEVDSLKPSIFKPNNCSSPIKTKSKLPASPAQIAAFAKFYQAYPLHKGRAPAEKAWLALNPDPELTAMIMVAVARYAEETGDTEPKRIKHPTGMAQ